MSSETVPTETTTRTGVLLREARERAGLSQRELAERLGCTQPAISYAEAGTVSIGLAALQRFAEALDCDLEVQLVDRGRALTGGVPASLRPHRARR